MLTTLTIGHKTRAWPLHKMVNIIADLQKAMPFGRYCRILASALRLCGIRIVTNNVLLQQLVYTLGLHSTSTTVLRQSGLLIAPSNWRNGDILETLYIYPHVTCLTIFGKKTVVHFLDETHTCSLGLAIWDMVDVRRVIYF